jgi:hypothetical protein
VTSPPLSSLPLTLVAMVGEAERPIAIAAARQVSAAASAVLGSDWTVTLILSDPDNRTISGSIRIASLIDDVLRDESVETTTRRWLERIERWSLEGKSRILLSTLFRRVGPADSDSVDVERLRRLNMMALFLSRSTGIEIVDIDRLFAWCGARRLATDYRCLGQHAAELGGHAIAAAIFAGGLDDFLPADVQEAAARQHGGIQDMRAILKRRVAEQ